MKNRPDVSFELADLHDASRRQAGKFSLRRQQVLQFHGLPAALSDRGADLMEVGAALFRIERQLKSAAFLRAAKTGEVHFRVRDPGAWRGEPTARLEAMLSHMASTRWKIRFSKRDRAPEYTADAGEPRRFSQVSLLSGGLDSACGAALLDPNVGDTLLFGYYTRRRAWQRELAEKLGPFPLAQLAENWSGPKTRGRSFHYRALFFLFSAAAVAEAVGARRILQAENGILATSIPPAPSMIMTRHATPWLQREAAALFGLLLGGRWSVGNPLLALTKQQALSAAVAKRRNPELATLLRQTDSCWSYNAITSIAGRKKVRKARGMGCGRCVSCIVRHTVFPDEHVAVDLRKDSLRNDDRLGGFLRSYAGFLQEARRMGSAEEFWHRMVPPENRLWLEAGGAIDRQQLWRLFRSFANELFSSYGISIDP